MESAFNVSNQVTIDAPALIDLTVTANYGVYAAACPPTGCTYGITTYDLGGQFQGSIGIFGGDSSLVVPLSATGDTEIPCDDGCGTGTLNLSDTESGEVFLDAGT